MNNYIVITFICVLMIYSANSHSGIGPSHPGISCVLSNLDLKKKYPAELSIKISSGLLKTNVIRIDDSQISVDETGETSTGVKYTVVDSDNYELIAVNINEITILYKDKQKLHLDSEALEIYIFQKLKTTKGTAYQVAQTVYSCSQKTLSGI